MSKGRIDAERNQHGQFQQAVHSYKSLLESPSVQLLNQSFTTSNRASSMYQFQHFLEINQLTPEALLSLSNGELQSAVMKAIVQKQNEGSYAAARRIFYVVRQFLELNGRELTFNKTQRKMLLKREPKKIARAHIPTREEIYRMTDSFPDKGHVQKKRGKALILCLWQSGVRSNCLCSWIYGIFKNQLYPEVRGPVAIKVVARREQGFYDCAVDTKLSSYAINYYYTFLAKEAAEALRDYLDERKLHGWTPKDSDPVFVTCGTVEGSRDKPLTPQHVIEIVKNAANQIEIPRASVWTHLLRKAFRKTLYSSGVDPDVAEALMGHKLGSSRTSYFDYHDVSFATKEYLKGQWTRLSRERVEQIEQEIVELRKAKDENVQLQERLAKLERRSIERDDLLNDTLAIYKAIAEGKLEGSAEGFLENLRQERERRREAIKKEVRDAFSGA